MSIELKQAAQQALEALLALHAEGARAGWHLHPKWEAQMRAASDSINALRTAIQQAESEPVWFHKHWCDGDDIFYRPDDNIPPGSVPLYTHPAPGVPDGLQWFTVDEHGLPEVGETVIGGLWYTDPWLKPDRATYFMWGQCSVIAEKHHDFKEGKRWLTFGPSHNQITHWARLTPPAMLTASQAQKGK